MGYKNEIDRNNLEILQSSSLELDCGQAMDGVELNCRFLI